LTPPRELAAAVESNVFRHAIYLKAGDEKSADQAFSNDRRFLR
jgi:hypothetical protein